jgi:hypothetical protein
MEGALGEAYPIANCTQVVLYFMHVANMPENDLNEVSNSMHLRRCETCRIKLMLFSKPLEISSQKKVSQEESHENLLFSRKR